MIDAVVFFLGFGACALVLQGAEVVHAWQERALRIRAARRRAALAAGNDCSF